MTSLRRLHIGTRLNLLVVLFVASLALVGGVAVVQISAAVRAETELTDASTLRSRAQSVVYDFADLNGWQNAYAFQVATSGAAAAQDDATNRKVFLQVAERTRASVADLGRRLEGSRQEWRDQLDVAARGLERFMTLDAQIDKLYRTGRRQDALKADDLVNKDEVAVYTEAAGAVTALAESIGQEQERVAPPARGPPPAPSSSSPPWSQVFSARPSPC
jgi:methyl-accepting chemotaxis protein